MNQDESRARQWFAENLHVEPAAFEQLARVAAALREENTRQNLIAASSLPQIWWRHIVDSAQLLVLAGRLQPTSGPWLDLGTGAGFPGLIIGILDAHRPVTLVEERRRRIDWLNGLVSELGLPHVTVAGSAIEKLDNLAPAVISARAFAPLLKLLQLAGRLSTPQTVWLLPKGEGAAQEVEGLPKNVRAMFHVEHSVTNPAAGIVLGRGVPRLRGAGGQ